MAKEGGQLKMSFRCRDEVKKKKLSSIKLSLLSELHQLLCLSGHLPSSQQHQLSSFTPLYLLAERGKQKERIQNEKA